MKTKEIRITILAFFIGLAVPLTTNSNLLHFFHSSNQIQKESTIFELDSPQL